MPPRKANPKPTKKIIKKLSRESESDDDSIDTKMESSESEHSQKGEEKEQDEEVYNEVDEDDLLGDAGNEIEDEDAEDTEPEEPEQEGKEVEEVQEEDNGGDDDGCIYTFKKNKKKIMDDDGEIEGDVFFDDEIKIDTKNIFVKNDERISKPILTKYERVRILGERARQISLGAKPMIKGLKNMDPKNVAKMELEKQVIPLIIIRPLPTGKKEKWKVSELTIIN